MYGGIHREVTEELLKTGEVSILKFPSQWDENPRVSEPAWAIVVVNAPGGNRQRVVAQYGKDARL